MQAPRLGVTGRLSRAISRRAFLETNHDLTKAIILAGTARSGTTWLAQILGKLLHYRLIFEPFSSERVPEYTFNFRQYLRPDEPSPTFRKFTERVLTGRIRNPWIDYHNRSIIVSGRIVKEVRASLYLKWVRNNFPSVPILYMLRHPCPVVYSWAKLGWGENDIGALMNQEKLVEDYLEPYKGTITKANSVIARAAVVWCVDQLVSLDLMEQSDWLVTTYEDLWLDPKSEINKIVEYVGATYSQQEFNAQAIMPDTVRPDSAVLTKHNPLEAWKNDLSASQIDEILEIVRAFALDEIYEKDFLPDKNNLNRVLKHAHTS